MTIRLCGFAAMETCELSSRDQCRDLTIGVIGKEGSTDTNGGEVAGSEHGVVEMMMQ